MAADLVRLPVDLIVTDSGIATQIAQQATRAIPIVAATAGPDPVATGLAAGLARPGGNVTGFTGFELGGKRVQLLKDVFPAVSRIGALWNPTAPVAPFRLSRPPKRRRGPWACSSARSQSPPRVNSAPGSRRRSGAARRAHRAARWDVLE